MKSFVKLIFDSNFLFLGGGNSTCFFTICSLHYWREDGAFIDFFSIIIFIQGEQVLNIGEARVYVEEEIQNCYDKYIHSINLE